MVSWLQPAPAHSLTSSRMSSVGWNGGRPGLRFSVVAAFAFLVAAFLAGRGLFDVSISWLMAVNKKMSRQPAIRLAAARCWVPSPAASPVLVSRALVYPHGWLLAFLVRHLTLTGWPAMARPLPALPSSLPGVGARPMPRAGKCWAMARPGGAAFLILF
ncbi:hypothetical protein DEH84_06970 [Aquabacterium olei]|uniref:Uncharacterized protein n=1 Tax=Aquabacterium olei TaxID=1296669 RepID=A0A2U8FQA3_9BURK|nr:hypothetical protein DEH84_06970 [Aquabacterium olei]